MDKEAQGDWYDMCQKLRNGQIDADYLLKWLDGQGCHKLPKDKPPLLSSEEIQVAYLSVDFDRWEAIAQAQREADIKWYSQH